MIMKRILITVGALLSLTAAQAQDIHFSQFYENNIMRNPALTGIFSGDYKIGANYRTQWTNISVPFQTLLVSGETRVLVNREVGDFISFGVTATYDKAGTTNFNSLQIYPAINYNKTLEDKRNSYLSVGFAGGYIQRTIDFTQSTFSSQYINGSFVADNPSGENLNNVNINNYDVAAGISLNSSFGPRNIANYYVAFGAYHLNKPKHTFEENNALIVLRTKYTANAGLSLVLSNQYGVVSHFNYNQQGANTEVMYGGLLYWRTPPESETDFKLYAGAFMRAGDAIIPTVKVDYEHYALTFSYDVNTSALQDATAGAGGYEISLFMKGAYKRKDRVRGALQCPRFEHLVPGSLGTGY